MAKNKKQHHSKLKKLRVNALLNITDKKESTEQICESVLQHLVNDVVKKEQHEICRLRYEAAKRQKLKSGAQYCDVQDCPTRIQEDKVSFHFFPKPNDWVVIKNECGVSEKIDRSVAWKKVVTMDTSKAESTDRRLRVCSKHFVKSDYIFFGTGSQQLKKHAVPKQAVPDDDVPDYIQNASMKEEPVDEVKDEPLHLEFEEIMFKHETILEPERPATPEPELKIILRTGLQEPLSTTNKTPDPLNLPRTLSEPELPLRGKTPERQLSIRIKPLEPQLSIVAREPELSSKSLEPESQTRNPEVSKIDSRCAACLSNQSSHNIYKTPHGNVTILKMLEMCTGYKMELEEQNVTQGICDICYKELLISSDFREKFRKSQNTLKAERKKRACTNINTSKLTTDDELPLEPSDSEPFDASESEYTPSVVPETDESDNESESSLSNMSLSSGDEDQPTVQPSNHVTENNVCPTWTNVLVANPSTEATPLECFEHFMGDVLKKITQYTNQSIRKQSKSESSFPVETCNEEVSALVGMLVFAGSVKRINMYDEALYSFLGTIYQTVIGYQRLKFLLEEMTFQKIGTKPGILKDDFTQFMHGIWNLFMDKCIRAENPDSTVTRIEHYLVCNAINCPVQCYRLEGISSYAIKLVAHYDSTNRAVVKSYPCTGNDDQLFEMNCCDPELTRSFGQVWTNFYCSQNSKRWTIIMFYAMLNIALINSYALHCEWISEKLTEEVFLTRLADALIKPWAEKSKNVIHLNESNAECVRNKNTQDMDQATKRKQNEIIKRGVTKRKKVAEKSVIML